MIAFFISIGLTYFVIGFGISLVFYFWNRRYFPRFWIVLAIGLIGSFFGGVAQYFFGGALLPVGKPYMGMIPSACGAIVFLWIFTVAMNYKES
jgi:hypothetical protein